MKTTKRKCLNCGKAALKWQNHKHRETVGSIAVDDATGFAWVCTSCGEWELTMKQLAGYELRAANIVLTRPGAVVSGAELKYARKALGLRQADLALLLGVASETLCRYEQQDEPPQSIALAVAGFVLRALRDDFDAPTILEAQRSPPPLPTVLVVRTAV